jgi:hypothetical protein
MRGTLRWGRPLFLFCASGCVIATTWRSGFCARGFVQCFRYMGKQALDCFAQRLRLSTACAVLDGVHARFTLASRRFWS